MHVKKSKTNNLEKKRGLFFQIGLIVTLSLIFLAFEWTTVRTHTMDLNYLSRGEIIEELAEVTTHQKKKIPEMPKPQIIKVIEEVTNETEVDEVLEISMEITDETVNVLDLIIEDDPDEGSEEPVIFIVAEQQPEFPGGLNALYNYLAENLDYPDKAKEVGIQGPVHVSFVVWNDGSIRDVKLLRGIGGGCDEEALRVIRNMPNWSPGKQRTQSVNVQMTIPVIFKLVN
jgi:protein TonB